MVKLTAQIPLLRPEPSADSPIIPRGSWPAIEAGEWLLVKLQYSSSVFLLQVKGNPVGLPESPCLSVAFVGSQRALLLRYNELQRLKRYRGLLPQTAH